MKLLCMLLLGVSMEFGCKKIYKRHLEFKYTFLWVVFSSYSYACTLCWFQFNASKPNDQCDASFLKDFGKIMHKSRKTDYIKNYFRFNICIESFNTTFSSVDRFSIFFFFSSSSLYLLHSCSVVVGTFDTDMQNEYIRLKRVHHNYLRFSSIYAIVKCEKEVLQR